MSEHEIKIMERALGRYGAAAQVLMVMEEMAELQKELCKHARGKANVDDIAQEIADVQIMLDQMILLHNCAQAVRDYREMKFIRLEARLKMDETEPVGREGLAGCGVQYT